MSRKQKMAEFEQGYKVTVTGRHVHVTQAMKDYAIEKISKLDHFAPRIIDVYVTMDIQKLDHRVEIVMKYGHTIINSFAVTTDMYASIDLAVHKLVTQIKKYKSKLTDHHAKAHPVIDIPVAVYRNPIDEELKEFNSDIEVETAHRVARELEPPQIVKMETQALKILTHDEAIMEMELQNRILPLVFRDEISRKIHVIYRREDGDYGIIQPEG